MRMPPVVLRAAQSALPAPPPGCFVSFFLCSFGTSLEQLLEVVAAIFVRRLQVVELLLQVGRVRLQLFALRSQTLLHILHRAPHEPEGNV